MRKIFLPLTFLTFILLFSFKSKAQVIEKINLTEKWSIVLNQAKPLEKSYVLDISILKFPNVKEKVDFFSKRIKCNLITFEKGSNENEVILIPQTQFKKAWKVEDWNKYLLKRQKSYKRNYELLKK